MNNSIDITLNLQDEAARGALNLMQPTQVVGLPAAVETEPVVAAPKIMGKPVYNVNTPSLNDKSGFSHKRLCDGLTFTAGTSCVYSCPYCYVESQVLKLRSVRDILAKSGKPFNEVVIRRNNALQTLAQGLTRAKRRNDAESDELLLAPDQIAKWGLHNDWSLTARVPKFQTPESDGKVIYASPLVDVAPTKELAMETVELCEMILRLSNLHIRLLSKSPLLKDVAEELHRRLPDPITGAKDRVIFGFSTGTLDDRIAKAIETHTPSPSVRLKALHWLQDNGFRTYGMICPILPQADAMAYDAFAEQAMRSIRGELCEEIWAEPVNMRVSGGTEAPEREGRCDTFQNTLVALRAGGFVREAELFDRVTRDRDAWEDYCRTLFNAFAAVAPEQTIPRLIVGDKTYAERPNKLWFLQYPQNYETITEFWDAQQTNGALLQGAVATRYRKRCAAPEPAEGEGIIADPATN